ncbi:MAG: F0F1 ATP synthase subunit gamma [Ignavibacteriaceae bacterium]
MNTREVLNDVENLKVFESLVETMRTMGSGLYPKLNKKIAPADKNYKSALAGMNSVKSLLLSEKTEITNSLILKSFSNERGGKVLIIPVGSNRAFCGDVNRKIIKKTEEIIEEFITAGREFTIVPIGKKLNNAFQRVSRNISGHFPFPEKSFKAEDHSEFIPIFKHITGQEFSSLIVVYTKLVPLGEGRGNDTIPTDFELFPFAKSESVPETLSDNDSLKRDLILEPTPEKAILGVIEQYLFTSLNVMLLHSLTSINYRRMNSMNQASKSIKDEILKLSRVLAKERKKVITKNLIEVISASIQEKELEKQIR